MFAAQQSFYAKRISCKRKRSSQPKQSPMVCTWSQMGNLSFKHPKTGLRVRACEACFKDDERGVRAIYPIPGKTGARLCTKHHREHGGRPKNLCVDCLPETNVKASYKDENGRSNRLCAKHARSRGCYETLNPCVLCPANAKKQACFSDANGRKTLCASHSKLQGSFEIRNPCIACPPDAKITATFADALGNPFSYCSFHAREQGCHTVSNPCENCPLECKLVSTLACVAATRLGTHVYSAQSAQKSKHASKMQKAVEPCVPHIRKAKGRFKCDSLALLVRPTAKCKLISKMQTVLKGNSVQIIVSNKV